jgi:hypothetical protein
MVLILDAQLFLLPLVLISFPSDYFSRVKSPIILDTTLVPISHKGWVLSERWFFHSVIFLYPRNKVFHGNRERKEKENEGMDYLFLCTVEKLAVIQFFLLNSVHRSRASTIGVVSSHA